MLRMRSPRPSCKSYMWLHGWSDSSSLLMRWTYQHISKMNSSPSQRQWSPETMPWLNANRPKLIRWTRRLIKSSQVWMGWVQSGRHITQYLFFQCVRNNCSLVILYMHMCVLTHIIRVHFFLGRRSWPTGAEDWGTAEADIRQCWPVFSNAAVLAEAAEWVSEEDKVKWWPDPVCQLSQETATHFGAKENEDWW